MLGSLQPEEVEAALNVSVKNYNLVELFVQIFLWIVLEESCKLFEALNALSLHRTTFFTFYFII